VDGTRTTINLNGTYRRERHEQQATFDRNTSELGLTVDYRLTPRTTLDLFGTYSNERFIEQIAKVKQWGVGAGLDVRLTRTVSFNFGASHYTAKGEGTFNDFDENRAYLRFSYAPARGPQ
jgi:uncharacterized protein (PEP-CTERM system associated)